MAELLIVDSDKETRNEIRSLVETSQYNFLSIYESSFAQRGLTLLKQSQPSALILDLSLPDMDGLDFGRMALELYPDLPIIVVTQIKMFELAQEAINTGFAAYLLKPLLRDILLNTFERILDPSLSKEVNQAIRQTEEFSNDLRKPIESAIHYIQLHYNEPLTLKHLADLVYLSPSYFSKLFKEETNTTFVEYLASIRVQKAKGMLRMSSLPIDVIANNTGFKNSGYFATTFKRMEGRTPTEYREKFYWKRNKKGIG